MILYYAVHLLFPRASSYLLIIKSQTRETLSGSPCRPTALAIDDIIVLQYTSVHWYSLVPVYACSNDVQPHRVYSLTYYVHPSPPAIPHPSQQTLCLAQNNRLWQLLNHLTTVDRSPRPGSASLEDVLSSLLGLPPSSMSGNHRNDAMFTSYQGAMGATNRGMSL